MLLTFISCFVIDLLSISNVFFSAIATDDHHPLWSCSINEMQYLLGDLFKLYCATGGILAAHIHIQTSDPLPVGQAACGVQANGEFRGRLSVCSKVQPHISR